VKDNCHRKNANFHYLGSAVRVSAMETGGMLKGDGDGIVTVHVRVVDPDPDPHGSAVI
jgi:hypothetical protein